MAAIEHFINHQKAIQYTKDFRKKEDKKVVEVVENREELVDKIRKSYFTGMTPFMMSSLKTYMSLAEFCGITQSHFNHLYVLDVRKLNQAVVQPTASLSPKHSNLSEDMLEVKENLAKILAEGGLFIISLDESIADTSKEDRQLVSTLNSLYNTQCLPHGILNKEDLLNPSIYKKVLSGTDYEKVTAIHPNAVVMVWGRLKPDTSKTDSQAILEKVKRKYERIPGVSEGIDMTPLNIYIIGN